MLASAKITLEAKPGSQSTAEGWDVCPAFTPLIRNTIFPGESRAADRQPCLGEDYASTALLGTSREPNKTSNSKAGQEQQVRLCWWL